MLRLGNSLEESKVEAMHTYQETGQYLISPTNDPDIVLGQGTVALEICKQLQQRGEPDLDFIVLPCGGGGLLPGAAIFVKGTTTKIVGSQTSREGPDISLGMILEKSTATTSTTTIADGLRSPVSPLNWQIIRQESYVAEIYSVTEDQIKSAMRLFFQSSGQTIAEVGKPFHYKIVNRAQIF